jgi:ribonuclease P protein component
MRRSTDFERAVRRGRRCGRPTVVLHASLVGTASSAAPGSDVRPGQALVGFVVSRAVGSAVVRNRVKRQLRAVVRARLDDLPADLLLVVRANPAAASASSELLAADLDRALPRLLRALAAGPAPTEPAT